MSDFEWQTENEAEGLWKDLPEPTAPKRISVPAWLGRWLLIGLGLLSLVGAVVYWQVNRRVRLATEGIKAELVATHFLLQQVTADEDEDLFRSMISGRDLNWVYAQLNRMERDLWQQRPSFRLYHEATVSAEPTITLSPDLTEAELLTLESYFVPASEPIQLQQTAVYRLGAGQRWLLSPPDDQFWGTTSILTGERVTLRFPERDRAVVEQLHADLETAVAALCDTFTEARCGLSSRVRVTLTTNPNLLLRGSNREAILRSGLDITLPTPTLVGLPVDEVGYERLQQGYSSQTLTALLAHLHGYECCEQQHFFTALVDKQLSQLGVQPWPMTSVEYDRLLEEPVDLERVVRLWHSRRIQVNDWRLVYAAIDFLLLEQLPNANLEQWQQELAEQNPNGHIAQWLAKQQGLSMLSTSWLQFLYSQTTSVHATAPPEPWPPPPLFECETQTHTVVEQFDFAERRWSEVYTVASPDNGYFDIKNQLTVLPNAQGFFVEQEQDKITSLHGNLLLGRPDETFMLLTAQVDVLTSYPGFYFTGEADPQNRYLMVASRDNPRLTGRHFLLDLEGCTSNDCHVSIRRDWATWSPDGSQTLLAGRPLRLAEGGDMLRREWQRPLFLGDALANPVSEIGKGGQPLWLNQGQYALLQINEVTDELQLAVLDAATHKAVFELPSANLIPLVPEPIDSLHLVDMQPLPSQETQLLLKAHDALEEPSATYFFRLDLANLEDPQFIFAAPGNRVAEPAPNGQWLAVADASSTTLIELATGRQLAVHADAVLWGPQGQWLLREFEYHTLLTLMDTSYTLLLTPNHVDCRAIGWAMRQQS